MTADEKRNALLAEWETALTAAHLPERRADITALMELIDSLHCESGTGLFRSEVIRICSSKSIEAVWPRFLVWKLRK